MPKASISASGYDKASDPVTVSLVATTSASSADILAFYAKSFLAQGFTAVPGDKVGDTGSRDFVRDGGAETANVAVVTAGGKATFTVGASVVAGSLQ